MANLAKFNKEMQSLMIELNVPNLRPFVCDGSPFECEVFIVGLNPATEMSIDPWKYWSDDYGFQKCRWFREYAETYHEHQRKAGKKRITLMSPSRERIECVVRGACPVKCLETNIYAKPSKNKDELKLFLKKLSCDDQKRLTAPFETLLKQVKPKLVVIHGTDAQQHFRQQNQTLEALGCEKWCEGHFSRNWSKVKAHALGCRIYEFFHAQL